MSRHRVYGPTETEILGGPNPFVICRGCHYGMIAKAICEALDEMEIAGKSVMVGGIGCNAGLRRRIAVDNVMYAHGAAPAVATAIKRVLGDKIVAFTAQGDGDCAAIGVGYLVNAAARAEKITVIMINNGIFAMTGGQLAPTTLIGQRTTTTPGSRDSSSGYPLHVPEMLASIKGVAYLARGSFTSPANYRKAKGYLKTAFQKQIDNVGLSLVEILSTCPVGWGMSPVESMKYIDEVVSKEFALGVIKDQGRMTEGACA